MNFGFRTGLRQAAGVVGTVRLFRTFCPNEGPPSFEQKQTAQNREGETRTGSRERKVEV